MILTSVNELSYRGRYFLIFFLGIILLDRHYHVDQKPAEKGKAYVFQLTTAVKNVLFAVEKEQIYNLLMFFLRTQIQLREDLEGKTVSSALPQYLR